MKERLARQLAFALELDKEKSVFRQTHLTNHGRRENDAEHAWHMALMAYLLREYANEPVDIARVMLMCLLHDVVEIDAGDTYAYDEAAKESQEPLPRSVYSGFCRRIRRKSSGPCLRSSTQVRARMHALRAPWITSSLFF